MRIIHVTDVYLPRLGGVELQVRDLAARQQARGHESAVVTTTPPGGPFGADGDDGVGPTVLRLGGDRAGAGPYRMVPAGELARLLTSRGADAVHAHVSAFSPLAWAAARSAGASGIPTVVSVHSMWDDIGPLMRRYARWQRAAAWPVRWAAVSTAAAAAVRDVLDGTPVTVLPNGIEPADWRADGTDAGSRGRPGGDVPGGEVPADVPTVVSVLRMVRRKRPGALLRALLGVHDTHPGRFRAVLVGDGPRLPGLRRELAAAGPHVPVTLTGALDRAAIRGLLAAADLYVAPATRESFGIAALEARSAGLPVLARTGTGVADFIRDGVEGWLVRSDGDLRWTIADLLDDPARLAAVARHNRAVAPHVRWDTVLDAAEALYAAARRTPYLVEAPA